MNRKSILPTVFCLLLIAMSFEHAIAQISRSEKGNLLLNQSRPESQLRQAKTTSKYRSIDGRYNNNTNSETIRWGAADIPLFREIPAQYGSADPLNAMGGQDRPSARKVSNVLVDEPVTIFNTRGLSTLVYQWGQFLDHEMSLTPTGETESYPITIPSDEIIFTEDILFSRSEIYSGSGEKTPRQQTNLNTSWIDGSMIYGSEPARAIWLRTLQNGKMKTTSGNLMPFNTETGEFSGAIDPNAPSMRNDGNGTIKTFVAGDIRAAENPILASLHTLFIREHNRICDRLVAEGLKNDEEIYQKARKEVGAIIQAITYQEFLPALGISLRPYSGYKTTVRPDLANTFATAAYRLGHTMVADEVLLLDNQCHEIEPGEIDIIDVFWEPQLVVKYGIDVLIKGAAAHDQYQTDTKITNVLRNFLFGDENDTTRFGIDLGSLNIQRGRDHGLPDYNTARKFYTGSSANSFSDITSNDSVATALKNLYGNVNNIDLWIGLLSENHLPNSSVGKTLHEMLRVQFEKLRDGDYYFYLNDPYLPDETRNEVRNTTLSDVIKRNTDLTNFQSNAFLSEECPGHGEEEEDSTAVSAKNIMNTTDKAEGTNLKMYPNPVVDKAKIDLGNIKEPAVIKIYKENGTLVKTITPVTQQKIVELDFSAFANGTYYIHVTTANQTRSLKFIKLSN